MYQQSPQNFQQQNNFQQNYQQQQQQQQQQYGSNQNNFNNSSMMYQNNNSFMGMNVNNNNGNNMGGMMMNNGFGMNNNNSNMGGMMMNANNNGGNMGGMMMNNNNSSNMGMVNANNFGMNNNNSNMNMNMNQNIGYDNFPSLQAQLNNLNNFSNMGKLNNNNSNNNALLSPTNNNNNHNNSNNSFYNNNNNMLQGFPSRLPFSEQQQQTSANTTPNTQYLNVKGEIPPISNESKAQYINVFYKIGGTDNTKLPGNVAKSIFQKSGLSNDDLSKIWNLSDIDKDGCLCDQEFSIAMHLIYAVKNGMTIPTTLPKHLVPASKIIYNVSSASNKNDWQTFDQTTIHFNNNNNNSNNVIQAQFQQQNFGQQQPQQQNQMFFSSPTSEFIPSSYVPKSNVPGSAITFEQRVALSSDLDAAIAKRKQFN